MVSIFKRSSFRLLVGRLRRSKQLAMHLACTIMRSSVACDNRQEVRVKGRTGNSNVSHPGVERPPRRTPKEDPWPVDVSGHDTPPCGCAPPKAKEPKPPCTRSTPKNDDCCERILEILGASQSG